MRAVPPKSPPPESVWCTYVLCLPVNSNGMAGAGMNIDNGDRSTDVPLRAPIGSASSLRTSYPRQIAVHIFAEIYAPPPLNST
jgi:hypothetical protein